MKTALYYAIRRDWRDNVVAVTSEKAGLRGGWHGRYCEDNTPTHGRGGDLMGRFETEQAAIDKREELKRIRHMYEERRKPHERAMLQLRRDENDAIEKACRNV